MTCPISLRTSDEMIESTLKKKIDVKPYENRLISSYNLPPGPPPDSDEADFVLNEKLIYKQMVETYVPKYGNVITMYKENKPVIIINDIDLGYDTFVKNYSKAISGRQATYGEKILSGNRNNILNSDYGPMWIVLQRHLHRGLRHCAKLERLEEIMHICFDQLKDSIEFRGGSKEGGIEVDGDMFWMADNVITVLLFNEILKEAEYSRYQAAIKVIPRYAEKCDFANDKPTKESDIKAVNDLQLAFDQLGEILQKRIDDHRQKGDYKIACFDITDFILLGVEEYHLDPRAKKLDVVLKDLHVKHSLIDVIFASQEGLGNSFVWVVGLLALHPDIQENIRKEISKFRDDKQSGVSLQWKSQMHFTTATLCEMQRMASADTFTDFHVTMDDIKIGAFEVPKGALVVLNLYAIHHEVKKWQEPEKLVPERFLTEDGQKFHRSKDFVPYGLGLRTCVGNTFSENVLFMLVLLLVDQYQLAWGHNPEGGILDDAEAVFIRDVVPFKVHFTKLK